MIGSLTPWLRSMPGLITLPILAVLSLSTPGRAAVYIQQESTSSGIAGMGKTESKSEIVISGQLSHTKTEMTIEGVPGVGGGAMKRSTVDVVRVPDETMLSINMEDQEYSKTSFATVKQLLSGEVVGEESGEDGAENVEFNLLVEEPGKKKKINGFQTEQKIIRIQPSSTDTETKQALAGAKMTVELWIATDVPGLAELRAFQESFAEKIGADPTLFQGGGGAAMMMGGGLGRLMEEMRRIEGYPILTLFTMETPMPEGEADSGVGGWTNQSGITMDMELMQKAGEAAKRGDMEEAQRLIEQAQRPATSGGDPSTDGTASDAGTGTMTLTVKNEVKQIRTTNVPQVSFEAPEGFKEVERQLPFQMLSR